MSSIDFSAPATVGRFMRSDAFVRLIAGPVGSGKTTGCIFEILRRAIEQRPGPDGIRRTRWAIVRQTLQQLKMTVLLDILTWLRPICTYKVSEQLVTLRFADVRAEIFLIPLEDPEDQKRLLSMQLTGAWASEGIEIDADLIPALCGRLGRYPSIVDGGPSWFGLIVDTNFPTIGSAWWELMELRTPPDWSIFQQPGGLEPDAENLENLPGGREYYLRLTRGNNQAWIDRYVHAKFGEDPAGTAVWKSFRRKFHVVDDLEPVNGQLIIVGQDFGRSPCSIICQPDHKGRLLVLEEVVAEDVGLEIHVTRNLKPRLWSDRYFGKMFTAVGDPSGKSKGSVYEETSFEALHRLGIPAFPAPSNDIEARLRGVEQMLLQQRDGGPAIVIDGSRCPMLVRALQGAYRFAKTKAGETKPLPEKSHPWSDLADGLQYVCLVYNAGLQSYMQRKIIAAGAKKERKRVSAAGWT
jgi:hypothetical protein